MTGKTVADAGAYLERMSVFVERYTLQFGENLKTFFACI